MARTGLSLKATWRRVGRLHPFPHGDFLAVLYGPLKVPGSLQIQVAQYEHPAGQLKHTLFTIQQTLLSQLPTTNPQGLFSNALSMVKEFASWS